MIGARHLWLPGLALVAAACGGDSTAPMGDPLTRDEAMAMATGLLEVSEGAAGALGSEASTRASFDGPSQGTFTYTLETSHPCPSGGSVAFDVAVNGSFDEAAGSASFALSGSQRHAACAFPHENLIFTVTGSPSLTFSASGAVVNEQPSEPFIFKVDGALAWSASDGREGRCPIHIDAVTDFVQKRRTVDARVCEHTFRETLTWS